MSGEDYKFNSKTGLRMSICERFPDSKPPFGVTLVQVHIICIGLDIYTVDTNKYLHVIEVNS